MYNVFEDWNISKKILAITSNNGSNVIKGLKALGCKNNTEYGYGAVRNDFIIRCLAHTIQLGVKKSLKILDSELKIVRALVICCKKGKYRQLFDKKS